MIDSPKRTVLDYVSAAKPLPPPHWRTSLLFILPAVSCAATFPLRLGVVFLAWWHAAIIAAIVSFWFFYRRPKPWHVVVCMTLNAAFLILAAVLGRSLIDFLAGP